jgi:hypothetical protein
MLSHCDHGNDVSSTVYPETDPSNNDLSMAPPPEENQPIVESEAGNSQTNTTLVIERFPHGRPGAPVAGAPQGTTLYESTQDVLGESIWAPFQSQSDWEIARWAKMRKPTSSAVTELLAIPEVCVYIFFRFITKKPHQLVDRLGLSYRTSKELNNIINKKLFGPPQFQCQDLTIGGEHLEFHYRDIIQCIRALFGDPEFVPDLVFAPERRYTDSSQTCRIYNEMHTGDWWCSVQVCNLNLR